MAVNAFRWKVAGKLVADITAVMGKDDGGAAGLAAAVTTSHQDWLDPARPRRPARLGPGAHAGHRRPAHRGPQRLRLLLFPHRHRRLAVARPARARQEGRRARRAPVAVGAYLVLSGAHPPARRAAITASVAFFAILLDRRAVSLHSLAIAALIILFIEPDVVVQPGFEMSFCATASLVALAELWRRAAGGRSALALAAIQGC
jgi:competence protein ComEC